MSGVNVDWVSERFGQLEEWTGPTALPDEYGRLYTQAGCASSCYTWADKADILVGNIMCPNGHASIAWGE